MQGKRSIMEICSLVVLILVLFCTMNVRNVQLVKLNGVSLTKSWSKSAAQQPFRHMHIRGFRPESLSTARGFGKRANNLDYGASQNYLLNPASNLNIFERLRLADSLYNKENINEPKDYPANMYRDDVNRYIGPSNLNGFKGFNDKKIAFNSEESILKGVNDDESSNNY